MKLNRKWTGFTLVEVLIALAVLTIVLGVVAASIGSSLQISRQSRINAFASEYVQSVAERYRAHWSVPANYSAGSTPPDLSALATKLQSANLTATINATQVINPDGTAFTGTGQPPLRRIVVEVRQGSNTRARLVTDIGNPQTTGLR